MSVVDATYYLVTSERGAADTRDFMAELVRFVAVAPTDTPALRYALSLPMADFEAPGGDHFEPNRVATYFLVSSSPSRTEPGPIRT